MHQMRRFGTIVNISRQSRTENLKSNFSGLFEYSIRLGNKHISWNYQQGGNPQYIPYVTAGVGHHKEEADKQICKSAIV